VEVIGRKARLTPKARRAMELLAVDERGLTETLLRTYGFTRGMLANLVRRGFATAQRQTAKAAGQTLEVVRIRITDAGREALAEIEHEFADER
jgi:DNA-binding PadR family transcriptional regulator